MTGLAEIAYHSAYIDPFFLPVEGHFLLRFVSGLTSVYKSSWSWFRWRDPSKAYWILHRFLRHTERTKVLVHVLDISGSEGRNPLEDFAIVNQELERYNPTLIKRPMVIAANKTDIPGEEDYLAQLKEALPEYEIFPISAATGEGLKPLVYRLMELVEQTELEVEEVTPTEEVKVTKAVEDEVKFVIEQDEFGVFVVSGPEIERQWRRTNFVNEDAVSRFLQIVEAMGVVKALREQGCQDGDTVRIKDVEFDFVD